MISAQVGRAVVAGALVVGGGGTIAVANGLGREKSPSTDVAPKMLAFGATGVGLASIGAGLLVGEKLIPEAATGAKALLRSAMWGGGTLAGAIGIGVGLVGFGALAAHHIASRASS
ncbi:MAG: hypothetical protein JWM25_271 [Thermoleophilia bacterium]|nr:hypothetical protein [Thermoleophilia bacterium]MCZ4495688.1 hypothetical protein [Thermoleophilia bacterium]